MNSIKTHTVVKRNRLLASSCAAALAAIASPAARAVPELILDLRVAGTGLKSASVSTANSSVGLELYALVYDPDGVATNTGFNATQGAWKSGIGGMLGNLSTSLISPFNNASGSQNPTPSDLDGDGDLDVGANASSTSGFWIASAGTNASFATNATPVEVIGGLNYRRFLIGTGTFTASSFNLAGTTLNYTARTGDAIVKPHKYFKDSTGTITSIQGTDARLSIGSAISISLSGANYTWTRGASSDAWETPANWGASSAPNSLLDNVTFGNTGAGTVALSGNRSVASLTFNSASTAYNIINATGTNTLSIGGTSGGTIAQNGAADVFIATAISASSLSKTGAGALELFGSGSSIGGTLNVDDGTLRVSGGSLGVSGVTNVAYNNSSVSAIAQSSGTVTLGGALYLGYNSGASGTYNLSAAGSLIITPGHSEFVGQNGTGTFNQSGGSHTINGDLALGNAVGGNGSFNLSDGTLNVAGTEYVGSATVNSTGVFTQIGGAHTVSNQLYVATGSAGGSAGTASFYLKGGTLDVTNDTGVGSQGTFNQTGGTYSTHGTGHLSVNGTYNLNNTDTPATMNVAGNEYIADNAGGMFNQYSGTHNVAGALVIGRQSGGNGQYNFSGGALNVTGQSIIGGESGAGTGTFTQTGGINTAGSDLRLGNAAGSSGTYNLSGAGVLSATGVEYIGNFGSGTFTQSGGTHTVGTPTYAAGLYTANSTGSTGAYNLSGGTLNLNGQWIVGFYGAGSVTQTGGTVNVGGQNLALAEGNTGTGTYALSGNGVLAVTGAELLGVYGQATFTQTGGTHTAQTMNVGEQAGSSGTYTISGGSFKTVSGVWIGGSYGGAGGTGVFNINSGATVDVGASLDIYNSGSNAVNLAGGTLRVAGIQTNGNPSRLNWTAGTLDLSPTGSFTFDGGGELGSSYTIGANKTLLTGDLTVGDSLGAGTGTVSIGNAGTVSTAGTLKVWNGASAVNVAAGGTLAANGLNMNGGTIALAADANPGRMNLSGDVSFTGTSATASITTVGAGAAPGTLDLANAVRTFAIADGTAAVDFSVGARIMNGGITKTGAGTMLLSGANAYAAATTIAGGALRTGSIGTIPTDSPVILSNGAVLDLNGFDQTLGSLSDSAGAPGAVTLGGALLSVGDASTTTFHGTIGGGTLNKRGSGTLELSGDLSLTGLSADLGILRLTGANSGLSGAITINGTGPTYATLALSANNLGSAALNLAGGHVLAENNLTFPLSRTIALGVGGGTLEVGNTKTFTANGVISGTGGLSKDGDGTLALGAINTYLGQTYVAPGTLGNGTLSTTISGALPETPMLMVSGSHLLLNSNNQTIGSLSGSAIVDLGGATLTMGSNGASTVFAGSIAGPGSSKIVKVGAGTMTMQAALGVSGGVTVNGGRLTLTANNSFTGTITAAGGTVSASSLANLGAAANPISLNGGTLALTPVGTLNSAHPISLGASGGTIDVASGGTLVHSASLTGATTLTKTGAGELQLPVPALLGGAVVIGGGTLNLTSGGTLSAVTSFNIGIGATLNLDNVSTRNDDRVGDGADLILSGGTFHLDGNTANSNESMNVLNPAAGASAITVLRGGVSGLTTLTFASIATPGGGATLDFTAFDAGATNKLIITAEHDALVANSQTERFFGGWLTVGGTDFAKYDISRGLVALDPANYSDNVFAPNANVRLSAVQTIPVPSFTIDTLTLNATTNAINVQQTPLSTLTISKGGVIKRGGNVASISGGSIASGNNLMAIRTSGGALTINSSLTGPMDLVKSGAGMLELTATDATHNFNGGVYLNAGVLKIMSDANLGVGAGAGNGVVFNGGSLQTGSLLTDPDISFAAGRTLTVSAAGGTLGVQNTFTDLTVANQLAGSGPLTKDGPGTLRISASNGFSGAVTIMGGHVELRDPDALGVSGSAPAPLNSTRSSSQPRTGGGGKSTIIINPGKSLDLRSDGPYPVTFGNDVVVPANGGGTSAANITTGPATIGNTAGVIKLGNLGMGVATLHTDGAGGANDGSLEFTGIVTLNGNGTLDNARDLRLSGSVTGTGDFIKSGNGVLTVGSGATDGVSNTYVGTTIVNAGKLLLDKKAGTIAVTGDVQITGADPLNRGTVELKQPRQISDHSGVKLRSGGLFDVPQSNAVRLIENDSGTVKVRDGATLFSKITTISNDGTVQLESTDGTPTTFSTDNLTIGSGGAAPARNRPRTVSNVSSVTAAPDTHITVSDLGVRFQDDPNNKLTISLQASSSAKAAGYMLLTANVTDSAVAKTFISNDTTVGSTKPGYVNLDRGRRTIEVISTDPSHEMRISANMVSGGIEKSGAGTLVLTGANAFTQDTIISGGTLKANVGSLGDTNGISMSGGVLDLPSEAAQAVYNNSLTLNDSSVIKLDRASAGSMQLKGLTIIDGTLQVTDNNIYGINTSLIFNGDSTFNAATPVINNGPAVTFDGAITGTITGTNGLTKIGAGTVTFAGANPNTYSSFTRVNAGTLVLQKSSDGVAAIPHDLQVFTGGMVKWLASNQVNDAAVLTANGAGSTFDLHGKSDQVTALDMTGGAVSTDDGATAGKLILSGGITAHQNATTATIAGHIEFPSGAHTIDVQSNANLTISAAIAGSADIEKKGNGILKLTGTNSLAGQITVTDGLLVMSNANFNGTIDLKDNSLIIQSTSAGRAAAYAAAYNQIETAVNAPHGPWTDHIGITSSTAAADTNLLYAVGIISNDDGAGGPLYPTFSGQTVDANAILIKSTYFGDANLDGTIDITDYSLIDTEFNSHLAGGGWVNGDFDYSEGTIDISDYGLIDTAFGNQVGQLTPGLASSSSQMSSAPEAGSLAGVSAVPEPATLGFLAAAGAGMLLRRRRREK